MNSLIIVGAGGFGLEVAAYAEDCKISIKGYWDDTKAPGTLHGNYNVLGPTDSPIDPKALYIIAVGSPDGRKKLTEKLTANGATFTTIIHPLSYVAASAKIGEGSIIAPFCFVGPEAIIGPQCALNVHVCAGHECRIGAYCVLSPHSGVHGCVKLRDEVFLGSSAYVTARLTIGNRVKISAGAMVYTHLPDGAFAIGNPAACRPVS